MFLDAGEPELAATPSMSVGIVSASQGSYSPSQLLLDISQGARIASSAYGRAPAPVLSLRGGGSLAAIAGWSAARGRASSAPQILTPGLLAAAVPGGSGYAGIAGAGAPDAAAAANRAGEIASVSIGSAATLPARIHTLLATRRFIVADLAPGAAGVGQLRELAARRAPSELLIALQRNAETRRGALLWAAVAGLAGGGGRELTSASTNERGLIVSVDLAPSILRRLGSGAPEQMRGRAIEASAMLHGSALRAFMARLRVLGGRRLSALGVLLLAWAALIALCAPWPAARARALRAGAVGVMWTPTVVMITATFAPSAAVEYLAIAAICLSLGAGTDALIPWPRAMIAPALVGVTAITLDALMHTQLLVRSLMGPNPILGARFYGIGNEVKSGLAVLVLAAVAGALHPAVGGRRAAGAMAAAGVALAAVEGSARIGAGVGGVILVSAGFAVAAASLLGGALTRRRTVIVLVSPLLALLALAVADLLTAHGSGHYTGSILHAHSAGELRDVIVRRYRAAWGELRNHAMPLATALSLAAVWWGWRSRERLLGPVGGDPAWRAAFAGAVTAGLLGAFSEDSGPVLLVVAVFALGCVASYLWASPSSAAVDAGYATQSRHAP